MPIFLHYDDTPLICGSSPHRRFAHGPIAGIALSPYASPTTKDQLIKECQNSFIKEISEKIENYSKLIEYKI